MRTLRISLAAAFAIVPVAFASQIDFGIAPNFNPVSAAVDNYSLPTASEFRAQVIDFSDEPAIEGSVASYDSEECILLGSDATVSFTGPLAPYATERYLALETNPPNDGKAGGSGPRPPVLLFASGGLAGLAMLGRRRRALK